MEEKGLINFCFWVKSLMATNVENRSHFGSPFLVEKNVTWKRENNCVLTLKPCCL